MKFRLLLRILGKGWAGSRPMGLKTGNSSRLKWRLTQRFLACGPLRALQETDPVGGEARDEGVVQDRVLIADEGPGGLGDASELFAGPEPVGADRGRAQCHLLFQAGHADLEELIEIAAHDAQELEAFEQRHRLVARLLEDPAVELEQRELAVEVEIGLAEVHHLLGRCRGGLGYLGRRGGARQGGARHAPHASTAPETMCYGGRGSDVAARRPR